MRSIYYDLFEIEIVDIVHMLYCLNIRIIFIISLFQALKVQKVLI